MCDQSRLRGSSTRSRVARVLPRQDMEGRRGEYCAPLSSPPHERSLRVPAMATFISEGFVAMQCSLVPRIASPRFTPLIGGRSQSPAHACCKAPYAGSRKYMQLASVLPARFAAQSSPCCRNLHGSRHSRSLLGKEQRSSWRTSGCQASSELRTVATNR